jgi:hypothetical protein
MSRIVVVDDVQDVDGEEKKANHKEGNEQLEGLCLL